MNYEVEHDYYGGRIVDTWVDLYTNHGEYAEIVKILKKGNNGCIFIDNFLDFNKIEQVIKNEEIKKVIYCGFMTHIAGVNILLDDEKSEDSNAK